MAPDRDELGAHAGGARQALRVRLRLPLAFLFFFVYIRPPGTGVDAKAWTSRPSRIASIRLASQRTRSFGTPNSAAVFVGSGKGVEITVFML
jgi:hypothetical protein